MRKSGHIDTAVLSKRYTEVFAWGSDRYGQLGLGTKQGGKCYCIPRLYTFNVVITQISCGEEHSAFITGEGTIFTMGSNADGRLGIGDKSTKLSTTPCLVETVSQLNAVQVSCGWGHTAAVFENGDLYTWGVGEYGALGIASLDSQWTPAKVAFAGRTRPKIRQVSCGTRHTAIVDDLGNLYMCGAGDAGQLGTNSREREMLPVHLAQIQERIKQAVCGIFHTLVLTEGGKVLAAGGNNFGQLGTGNKKPSFVFVPTKGLDLNRIAKIAAGNLSACLTDTGKVYVWGTGVFGEYLFPTPINGLTNPIKDLSIGGCFGVFVDTKGTAYTWGSNASGELGLGDYESRNRLTVVPLLKEKVVTEVSCGGSYAIALGETVSKRPVEEEKYRSEVVRTAVDTEGLESLKGPLKEQFDMREDRGGYKEKLLRNQEELENNNKKVLIKIENERERAEILRNRKREIEKRVEEMERRIDLLREEKYRAAVESDKTTQLLREYKERADHEKIETRLILQSKTEEIRRINEEIYRLEIMRESLQRDKVEDTQKYRDEVEFLERELGECKGLLQEKRIENDRLLAKRDNSYEPLRNMEKELELQVTEHETEMALLKEEAEHLKLEILSMDHEIRKTDEACRALFEDLRQKEQGLEYERTAYKEKSISGPQEIEHLKRTFEDSLQRGEELQKTINVKQAEIDSLNKETSAWSQVADKVRNENTELKRTIETLELENKRLLENMNLHLYNRAAEYKERTLRALQNPASPFRASIKSQQKPGVGEIAKLTQFAADTVENIKRNVGGTRSAITKKGQFNPDYVLDKETYKVEEDPKYVKTNYELIQLLDKYDPPKQTTLKVQLEENKTSVEPFESRYETPKRPLDRHQEILRTTQELLQTLTSSQRVTPIKGAEKVPLKEYKCE